MKKIKLYQYSYCPFCAKVRNKINELNIQDKVELISIENSSELKEFVKKEAGKLQVPFLVDENKNIKMLESDDINDYLEQNYRK
ncbi:MAG: glutathione S-transferase N-terminal domain-containing protein [Candidatus Woesearchaeota archaeon]